MGADADKLSLARECCARGKAAFPLIDWAEGEAVSSLLHRWAAHDATAIGLRLAMGEGFAEEYLISASLAGRPRAADALEKAYIYPLRAAVYQICRDEELTDEVLQSLREKLLLHPKPRLARYENRGRLGTWLTVVATRSALDAVRSRGQQRRRDAELTEELAGMGTGPEIQLARHELHVLLRAALKSALLKLPSRERHALRLHLVSGWNINQIGRTFGTHRATAARWLVTARERLEREVRAELCAQGGIADHEIQSFLGGIRSRFDLRLSQLFQSAEALATAAIQ